MKPIGSECVNESIKLSKKPSIFRGIFCPFFESPFNFQCFEKKNILIGQVFLKLFTPKDVII